MRKRIAGILLSGTTALAALAAPGAAYADTASAPTIDSVKATSVVLGITNTRTVTYTVTVSDDSGIKSLKLAGLPAVVEQEGLAYSKSYLKSYGGSATCTASSATTSVCSYAETYSAYDYEADQYVDNDLAGNWDAELLVTAADGGTTWDTTGTVFTVKRNAEITLAKSTATPKKSSYFTLSGKLTRADLDNSAYKAYSGRTLTLQFEAKGGTTWSAAGTATTSSTGAYSYKVKASSSGSYRVVWAGNGVTGAVTSAAAAITVK